MTRRFYMTKDKWIKLTEVYGQLEAENYKSLLEAYGIDVEIFQESVGKNFAYPVNVGRFALVEIYVKERDFSDATELIKDLDD
jgi:hypothetical protein